MLQEIKNKHGWSHVSFIRATQSLLYVYFQIRQLCHENKVHRLKSVTLKSWNNRRNKLQDNLTKCLAEKFRTRRICLMKILQHKFSNQSFIMILWVSLLLKKNKRDIYANFFFDISLAKLATHALWHSCVCLLQAHNFVSTGRNEMMTMQMLQWHLS